MLRGAMSPEMGRAEDVAKKIRIELEKRGLQRSRSELTSSSPRPVRIAARRDQGGGRAAADVDARVIKTRDEISLLNMSAMMVDAAMTSCIAR